MRCTNKDMRQGYGESKASDEKRNLLKPDTEEERCCSAQRIWPYLVWLSVFLTKISAAGFNYGIAGSITEVQTSRFNVTLSESSLTASVHSAVFLGSAPLTGIMTRMIAIRKIQLAGAVLSVLGVGLCYLATQLWNVVLLFGIVAGLGLSLVRSACVAIPIYHFEGEKLNFANAATMFGFCLGIFIYPVPTTSLFVSYGFNEAMIMFSPIMLIHILGVVFFSQKNGEVAANKLPERKSVKESVSSMTEDPKIWAFLLCGFFREIGITAFFSIVNHYAIHSTNLTIHDAAHGTTIMGGSAIIGIAIILFTTLRFRYSKLTPHAVTCVGYALFMFVITLTASKEAYFAVMAALGITYGLQVANILGAAQELVGAADMPIVLGFELFMQGVGGLIGGPIAGQLQLNVGERFGLYFCAVSCFIAGSLIATASIHKHYDAKKSNITDS